MVRKKPGYTAHKSSRQVSTQNSLKLVPSPPLLPRQERFFRIFYKHFAVQSSPDRCIVIM